MKTVRLLCLVPGLAAALSFPTASIRAEQPVEITQTRQEIEDKWRARIQSFLDKGVIPLIDMESYLPRKNGEAVLGWTMQSRRTGTPSGCGTCRPRSSGLAE